jgi:hypothetical protein
MGARTMKKSRFSDEQISYALRQDNRAAEAARM